MQNDVKQSVIREVRSSQQPANTVRWPLWGTHGISSFWLKIIAIVAMTCDHAGLIFFPHLPFIAQCLLIMVGGITFPVMAFLLVEGYRYTSNLRAYAIRLGVFALISEVPYWLFLQHGGNVLFTLLIGLAVLWVDDHVQDSLLRLACLLSLFVASAFCDWGVIGPVMVMLFYRGYNTRAGIVLSVAFVASIGSLNAGGLLINALKAAGNWGNLPFLLYSVIGNTSTIPLLFSYNGRRGKISLKWFFYVYYPAHIAVLGLLHMGLFGSMPMLLI